MRSRDGHHHTAPYHTIPYHTIIPHHSIIPSYHNTITPSCRTIPIAYFTILQRPSYHTNLSNRTYIKFCWFSLQPSGYSHSFYSKVVTATIFTAKWLQLQFLQESGYNYNLYSNVVTESFFFTDTVFTTRWLQLQFLQQSGYSYGLYSKVAHTTEYCRLTVIHRARPCSLPLREVWPRKNENKFMYTYFGHLTLQCAN